MENEQEISSSTKHQKTKQKWKASADALKKSDKTKIRSETLRTSISIDSSL